MNMLDIMEMKLNAVYKSTKYSAFGTQIFLQIIQNRGVGGKRNICNTSNIHREEVQAV
jgi:hypothetical protein